MAQPPKIYNSGPLNSVWNYTIDQVKKFAKVLGPYLKFGEVGDTDFPLVPGSIGPKVSFRKKDFGDEKDVIIPGVLEITRSNVVGENGNIYNVAFENVPGGSGPLNTEWNSKMSLTTYSSGGEYWVNSGDSGWAFACNAINLEYRNWYDVIGPDWANPRYQVDQNMQLIMHETTTDRYWLIQFTDWTGGGADRGRGFAYDRWEIFPKVDFVRPTQQPDVVDVITPGKTIIKRLNNYGIFNAAVENSYAIVNPGGGNPYGFARTPTGTLWNSFYTDRRPGYSGWGDLTNVKNRIYNNWAEAMSFNPTQMVTDEIEFIMLDQATGNYYMVIFTNWGQGGNNGAFSYTRRLIPQTKSVNFASGVNWGEGGAVDYAYVRTLEYNDAKVFTVDGSSYDIRPSDRGCTIITGASTTAILISASLKMPIGSRIDIINGGTNPVSFGANPPANILSENGLTTLADQWAAASLIYTAPDTWVLVGKLS